MKYQEIMSVLSQSGLGALVMEADSRILAVNQALLHGAGKLEGKLLSEIALPLSMQSEKPVYASVVFGEYLLRCPAPNVENLPPHTQLVVFRNSTADAMQDILMNVVNQLSEALFVCDADSRILFLNDAGVRMESMDLRDIRGARTEDVYQMRDGSKNNVPEVIRTRKPKLNHRQYYTTRYGKDVDIVSNNYPIVQNGQILGGFSVMEDWSRMDSLHKQILELQEKLRDAACCVALQTSGEIRFLCYDIWRNRNGKRTARAKHSQCQPKKRRAVFGNQLRGDSGKPAGELAVRHGKGCIYRSRTPSGTV